MMMMILTLGPKKKKKRENPKRCLFLDTDLHKAVPIDSFPMGPSLSPGKVG